MMKEGFFSTFLHKKHAVGTQNRLSEAILLSTFSTWFYGEVKKIILQLSSNIYFTRYSVCLKI